MEGVISPIGRFLALLLVGVLGTSVLVLFVFEPALLTPHMARADSPGDWPMFRHDAGHAGYNSAEAELQAPLRLKWSYRITGGGTATSPAVANGIAYVSAANGISAFDALTGAAKWDFQTGGPVVSAPAVAGGMVYFDSADKNVYAVDAVSGSVKWSYPTGGIVNSSPAVDSNTVYVGSADGKVYALDATSGALKWSSVTAGPVDSSPAVAGGIVYFGSYDQKMYGLDAQTGASRWSFPTQGNLYSSSPAVANGVVFFGSYDTNVYAVDASTGQMRWKYTTGGAVGSSPAVANGIVYVGSYDGNLYALDAGTGGLKWQYSIGFWNSAPAIANGLIYVVATDNNPTTHTVLLALDAQSGAVAQSYPMTEANCGLSPAAIAGGRLYIGACSGVQSTTGIDLREEAASCAWIAGCVSGQSTADITLFSLESQNQPTSIPSPTPTATPSIPNLSVANVAARDKAFPDETLTYMIALDNSGPSDISVALTGTIPGGTSFVSGTLAGGAVYSPTINSILWSGLAPSAASSLPSQVFSYRVRLGSTLVANTITNTVRVSSGPVTVTRSATTPVWKRIFLPLMAQGPAAW